MHEIRISSSLLQRLRCERNGRFHLFDKVDPAYTAHLAIDMQNGFMELGASAAVPFAREIVPSVNAISRAVRAAGGRNYFLQYTTPDEPAKEWSNFYLRLGTSVASAHQEAFKVGEHHWKLWPELEVRGQDALVRKTRFSAFVPGTCGLQDLLGNHGIDTLIVTGTLTNVCCESTARDAMQLNYKVIFVSDATAALTDEEHNATLNNMMSLFADVMTVQEVLGALCAI